jgi:hypothetical protein
MLPKAPAEYTSVIEAMDLRIDRLVATVNGYGNVERRAAVAIQDLN